jgi:hypothetical protein
MGFYKTNVLDVLMEKIFIKLVVQCHIFCSKHTSDWLVSAIIIIKTVSLISVNQRSNNAIRKNNVQNKWFSHSTSTCVSSSR